MRATGDAVMTACVGCGETNTSQVLDLGCVPAADYFPMASEPVREEENQHPLAMVACHDCGLAQLAGDDTATDEPRAVEPQALRDQALDAVDRVASAGLLSGATVLEFGSPHGGSWVPLLTARGFVEVETAADLVIDCFGIMHEPDQRGAFEQRARLTRPGGVLLLQYHSIATIVKHGQWNALRHGHFAYYSLSSLIRLLGSVGMHVAHAWDFDLYGGTVLLAVVHESVEPDPSVQRILAGEEASGIGDPLTIATLQSHADKQVSALRAWLEQERAAGRKVLAYGAASRAVALFSLARIDSTLLRAVADASTAKQGRRMPGTAIPIVSPERLLDEKPDSVLLTLPDLLDEVTQQFPELEGKWKVDAQ